MIDEVRLEVGDEGREERLKKMKDNLIHLTTHDGASISKSKSSKKDNRNAHLMVKKGRVHKENKCHFYKKSGHFKKYCLKRKKWFEKKDIFYIFVNF